MGCGYCGCLAGDRSENHRGKWVDLPLLCWVAMCGTRVTRVILVVSTTIFQVLGLHSGNLT